MDMILPVGRVYHVGYVVPDLREAMKTMGEIFQCEWVEPKWRSSPSADPDHSRLDFDYWVGYSSTGPPHIELIEGPPGSVWDSEGTPRIHHVGRWVDSLASESKRLTELGHPIVAFGIDEDGEMDRFAYHDIGSGPLLEIVAPTRRAEWLEWMTIGQANFHAE